ncbi:hypothetical protein LSAT2_029333, partial [Lamellibrachia satsuma]
MQEYMQEDNTKDIVRQSSVNGAAFYSIQAGVVRDVSNTEQLGIVIRVSRWIQRNAEPRLMMELVLWLVSSMVV